MAKAHIMKVQILKPFQISKSRKLDISKKFPYGKFFLQNNLEKTRKFYEFILVDTDSMEISHIQNKTSIDIFYSKYKIYKVISPKKCGVNLLTLTKCFFKLLDQSHVIIMVILMLGTIPFSSDHLITHGFSTGVMK